MRAIAEFIMRGRMQATLVVVGCAALPLLFWWYFGDPRIFMVLVGSLGLAMVLRASESWVRVLLVSVALGLLYAVVLGAVFREPIEAMSQEFRNTCRQCSPVSTIRCP